MNTTLTEISNIFNLMVQADSRLKFYHFGWRSDINKNIDNNFDKGVKTGRLFPALHFDIPDFFQPTEELNFLGFKEDIAVNLYFDDLQNYDNSGEQKTETLIEQWANLKQIAEDFINNLAEVLQYYKAGFIRTIPRFEPKSNLFNDRLITFEVSFTIAHYSECTEESNKINLLSLPAAGCFPAYDLENYLKELECKSLQLDGVNEYINCGNNTVFNQDFNTPFSIGLWVKANSLSLLNFMLTKFDISASKGWEFTLLNGKIRLIFSTGPGATTKIVSDGTTVINVDKWYHLVMTYDGTNNHNGITLYIDGAIDIKSNSSGSGLVGTVQNAKNLQIGGQDGFYFNGNIASVRMWNIKLTPTEILEEYNGGKIKSMPVNNTNIIVNTALNCATWNGTAYDIPDDSGITTGYTSVNSEELDLLTDCP